MMLKIIDGLIWLKKPLTIILKKIWSFSQPVAKLVFVLLILPPYRLGIRLRQKTKNIKRHNLRYLFFVKKYLPRLLIFFIILAVSVNSIFAQTYSSDEIASKSLLLSLVESDEGWSELIEEDVRVVPGQLAVNYLAGEGAIQAAATDNPLPADTVVTNVDANFSAEIDSLVMDTSHGDVIGEFELPPTGRSETIEYEVQPGDVPGTIAEKFGLSINTILWENKLTWSSTIRPGQKLRILPKSGINYEVKSGDTISAIAKKYQSDNDEIIAANQLASAADIRSGDLIFIPNGIKPTEVKSSYQPRVAPARTESAPVVDEPVVDTGTKLLWPIDSQRITQYFSWKHSGLDIGDKTGKPIYAAESGKVERAGWNSGGYGNYIIINHGNGLQTLYAHASKLYVEEGDEVSRGDLIAAVGSTGWSTGPHLHFEVRVNGNRKNALNYIK